MANTTKRMLSLSLKKLLGKNTLDNITIQDITDDAEVSRKPSIITFRISTPCLNGRFPRTADTFLKARSSAAIGRKASSRSLNTCRKTA